MTSATPVFQASPMDVMLVLLRGLAARGELDPTAAAGAVGGDGWESTAPGGEPAGAAFAREACLPRQL
ncbi:hypothetical protein FOS14_22135 [Skermania sp. ID1734]|uniref:hypothetical protein n=1 Tax=Skermania sp. ID1734 TaxID=2597516 RepID=UPI00117D0BB7|nr:hypothetical protein [Skermania sp. ID1734]TSD93764.1 hypothetical protein FOS14_22135 [Skermania sp. ID1734]